MAARSAGSGRTNLVFVGADRWRDGATILGQDCALSGAGPESVQVGMPGTGNASWAATTQSSLLQADGVAVYGFTHPQTQPRICQPAMRVTSAVPKPPSAGYNVVLEGQPFAITGDTILTVIDLGGGVESVQVVTLATYSEISQALSDDPCRRPSASRAIRPTSSA
jgi:hypothetical protein